MVRPRHKSRVVRKNEDADQILEGGEESVCPKIPGVTKDDQLVLKRVVGMLEYYMALQYLQPAWDNATETERTIMDEMVRSAPELAFFSQPLEDGQVPEKRHGMVWALALARLEFNAIIAGFSHADRPFAFSTEDAELQQAYHELLLEALRVHMSEVFADPEQLAKLSKRRSPDFQVLSTMKRLSMTHAFAEEALRYDRLRSQIPAPVAWQLRRDHGQVTKAMQQIRSNMLHFIRTNKTKLSLLDREAVVRAVTLR